MTASLFFNQFLVRLEESIESHEFTIWFNQLHFERISDNTLFLQVKNKYVKDTIENRYSDLMLQVAQSIETSIQTIDILIKNEKKEGRNEENLELKQDLAQPTSLQSFKPSSKALESPTDPFSTKNIVNSSLFSKNILAENRFERFIITEENDLAYRFIQKSITQLGAINPLFIYGSIGTGKTHLLQSVYHHLTNQFKSLKIRYVQPDDFVGEYTRAIQLKNGADRDFRLRYRELDVLLIDDIQFFMGKTKSNQEFFHIFNRLLTPNKQMIFCSDRTPRALGDIDERLKSRLHSSVILEIKPPHFSGRLKILNFLASENKLPLEKEVCQFLAENFTGDIRHIVGAIKYLTVLHSLHKIEITIDYCKQHIEQLNVKRKEQGKYRAQDLIDIFCKKANISRDDLRSVKRHSSLANYRHMAMYLLKEHTNLSLRQIGELMGKRTAASVSQSHKKIVRQITENSDTKDLIFSTLNQTSSKN